MGRRDLIVLRLFSSRSFLVPSSTVAPCFPVSVQHCYACSRHAVTRVSLVFFSLLILSIVLLIRICVLRRSIVVQDIDTEMNPGECRVHSSLRHCHVTFLLDLCSEAHLAVGGVPPTATVLRETRV